MFQKKITTSSSDVTARIFGSYDKNIARLESEFSVSIRNGQNENDDGDTIVNRKLPKTGDDSRIGLWIGLSALSACAFILLMKKWKEA